MRLNHEFATNLHLLSNGTCAEDNFRLWAERVNPRSRAANTRSRPFSSLAAKVHETVCILHEKFIDLNCESVAKRAGLLSWLNKHRT